MEKIIDKGGNKGERAELAVFLSMVNPGMNIPDPTGRGRRFRVEVVERDGAILVVGNGRVSREGHKGRSIHDVIAAAGELLASIDEGGGKGAVAPPGQFTAEVLSDLGLLGIAGGHRGKADISMSLIDDFGERLPFHVSFKSFLGSPPSLFNSGAGATALYDINPPLDVDDVTELNKLSFKERISRMASEGRTVSPHGFLGDFGERLAIIDKNLPEAVLFALACAHGLGAVRAESIPTVSGLVSQMVPGEPLRSLVHAATTCLVAGGWSQEPFPDSVLVLRRNESGNKELAFLNPYSDELFSACRFVIPIAGRSDEDGFDTGKDRHGLIVSAGGDFRLALGLQIRMSDPFSASNEKQSGGIGILRNRK